MKGVYHCLLLLSTIWMVTKTHGHDQFNAYGEIYGTIPHAYDNASTFDENFNSLLAIFCPESVFCPTEVGLITDWTSTVLNESTVFNEWIFANTSKSITEARWNLVHLSQYMKGCCKACSCENKCWERRNCCPVLKPEIEQKTPNILQECVHSSIKHYVQDKPEVPSEFYGQSYYMVIDCFLSNTASETTKQKCRYPDFMYPDQITPVHSHITGRIYRNTFCAECNDDVDVTSWTLQIDMPSVYASALLDHLSNTSFTYHSIINVINRNVDITFMPPEQLKIKAEDPLCVFQPKEENEQQTCKQSFSSNDVERFLWYSCSNYNLVYRHAKPHRNVFCYICKNDDVVGTPDLKCDEPLRFNYFEDRFTALLGFGSENSISVQNSFTQCRCNEFVDKQKEICRPLFCPAGEMFFGCSCKSYFEMKSGLPLRLYTTLVPLLHTSLLKHIANKRSFLNEVKLTVSQTIKSFNEAWDINVVAMFQDNGQINDSHTKFHILSIIQVKYGSDGNKATKEIFDWLQKGVHIQVSEVSMILSLGQIYDTLLENSEYVYKSETGYTQTNTSNNVVNLFSNSRLHVNYRYATVMDKFLFCKSIQLSQEEDDTMPNKALEHGYSATWISYIYRSTDKKCCLNDYINIFTKASMAVCLSVNNCLIVILLQMLYFDFV